MSRTTAERFIESRGAPLTVGGRTVVGVYRREVLADEVYSVKMAWRPSDIVHGVSIKMPGGHILINNQKMGHAETWSDTAAEVFEFKCLPGKESELHIWNCWRYGAVTNAWIGSYGIVVRQEGDTTVPHCSSGPGDFDPEDLVVTLTRISR
jgi:hypothetical protein